MVGMLLRKLKIQFSYKNVSGDRFHYIRAIQIIHLFGIMYVVDLYVQGYRVNISYESLISPLMNVLF